MKKTPDMIITAELSLYPLSNDYSDRVVQFIKILRDNSLIETKTGGTSTLVRGQGKDVMEAIQTATLATFSAPQTYVLVAKYLNADAYDVPQID